MIYILRVVYWVFQRILVLLYLGAALSWCCYFFFRRHNAKQTDWEETKTKQSKRLKVIFMLMGRIKEILSPTSCFASKYIRSMNYYLLNWICMCLLLNLWNTNSCKTQNIATSIHSKQQQHAAENCGLNGDTHKVVMICYYQGT